MNPNDLLAQEEAMANQIPSLIFHFYLFFFVAQILCSAIGAFVLYMFYARLRDMAHEIRRLRVAYENAHSQAAKPRTAEPSASQSPANEDARYLPKKWMI